MITTTTSITTSITTTITSIITTTRCDAKMVGATWCRRTTRSVRSGRRFCWSSTTGQAWDRYLKRSIIYQSYQSYFNHINHISIIAIIYQSRYQDIKISIAGHCEPGWGGNPLLHRWCKSHRVSFFISSSSTIQLVVHFRKASIYRVFFSTGPPPKSSKYKKVDLG